MKKILLVLGVSCSLNVFANKVCFDDSCGTADNVHGIEVLNLSGSYFNMGQQYGVLEKNKLIDFYTGLNKLIDFTNPTIVGYLKAINNTLPERNRQILTGISKSTGLSFDSVLKLSFAVDFAFTPKTENNSTLSHFGCSAVEATSPYTDKNFGTLIGRIYDMPSEYFDLYKNYTGLVIYKPINGDNSVITLSYLGQINGLSGINDKGITSEIDNGLLSVPTIDLTKPDDLINNFTALFTSNSINDFNEFVYSNLPAGATNTGVADVNTVQHYERTPFQAVIATKTPNDALDIYTNTFIDSGFKNQQYIYGPGSDSPSKTYERENNLKSLFAPYYGLVTPDMIKTNILKSTIEGGAFNEPGNTYNIDTSFHAYVYDMKNNIFSVYVPTVTDGWVDFNVSNLFNGNI